MNIERVANVVVIAVAVCLAGLGVYDRVRSRENPHEKRATGLVGKNLGLPPSLTAGCQVTAVLFVSKDCHFCSESMPFYVRISSLRTKGSGDFRLLAVTPSGRETVAEGERYLAEHHLPVDGIGQLPFTDVGIVATPTLALLDSSGRVFKAWRGTLPASTEAEVIGAIRGLCSTCRASSGRGFSFSKQEVFRSGI